MVDAVVFSKNRPAQLDLFLKTAAPYLDIFNLKVIYLHTEKEYELGYSLLKRLWSNVFFEKETDLKAQTLSHLKNHFCFFTDDSFFYREFNPTNFLNTIPFLEGACFSLRLGFNTWDNHGYPSRSPALTEGFGQEEDIIWWNPKEYGYHECYGYSMSVDGHVYSSSLLDNLHNMDFDLPNKLEEELKILKDSIDRIYSFENSVLVINPINRVQDFRKNWCGEKFGISTHDLNKNFLKGKRLSFKNIEPTGTHFESEVCFV